MSVLAAASTPIDVSWVDSPTALRDVARAASKQSARGDELMLVATNNKGGALALNSLLNLEALRYRHALLVAYERDACATLGAAIVRLPESLGRSHVASTPCVFDSWWERTLPERGQHGPATALRQRNWLVRWSIFARLVRLGYNVLCVDTDAVLLDAALPHLHAEPLCGTFALMFGADYDVGAPWLQNGVVYACGAARDGAAAWVMAEMVDRYLRLADACGGTAGPLGVAGDGGGGGGGGGAGASADAGAAVGGTACPAGSWLHGARRYDGFHFDQWVHRSVVQCAAQVWRCCSHIPMHMPVHHPRMSHMTRGASPV